MGFREDREVFIRVWLEGAEWGGLGGVSCGRGLDRNRAKKGWS